MNTVTVQNLAQISQAKVEFGDLTVLVGPQATGKSIFLQLLKLILDYDSIQKTMRNNHLIWNNTLNPFLDIYFGEGMSDIYKPAETTIHIDGQAFPLKKVASKKKNIETQESMFYVPAQRVLALRDGMTRPFSDYRPGDPFVLRDFSDKLHTLIQSDFSNEKTLFPHKKRLKRVLKDKLAEHIFANRDLTSVSSLQLNRLMLVDSKTGDKSGLPYLVWSAGQREFTPLLMGLYWLLTPSKTPKKKNIEWVVIEEPEMGLHPQGIETVMLLVMELLERGYKVILSTHSPHVLDVVWAVQSIRSASNAKQLFLELFQLNDSVQTSPMAQAATEKKYKVYYFNRNSKQGVQDISELDPGSDDPAVRDWGGLTGFSGRAGDIVGKAVE